MSTRPPVSLTTEAVAAALGPALAKDDEANGWAWLSLLDTLCTPFADLDALVRDRTWPGWEVVFDARLCPPQYLPWLAQWAGVRYDRTLPAETNRARILAREGATAGTVRELVEAVRSRLSGSGGIVRLLERDTGPHHITVQVFASQTPDPAAVEAAIAAVKPARVIVDLEVRSSSSYAEVRASKTGQTYAARQAAYPTYDDVNDYLPGA